jgi:hypothetical protein
MGDIKIGSVYHDDLHGGYWKIEMICKDTGSIRGVMCFRNGVLIDFGFHRFCPWRRTIMPHDSKNLVLVGSEDEARSPFFIKHLDSPPLSA